MKPKLIPLLVLPLLAGCAQLGRPLTDAALGAGGAYLGHALSDGNPAAIAGGAAGGVLIGEGIHAWKSGQSKKAYGTGYVQGRSDGVKQLYWNLQTQQRAEPEEERATLYEVTIPEHWEDGALVQPTQRVIRIQE
jgi:hypothetical protein